MEWLNPLWLLSLAIVIIIDGAIVLMVLSLAFFVIVLPLAEALMTLRSHLRRKP